MRTLNGYKERLAGKSFLMVDDEDIVVEVIEEVLAPVASRLETASNGMDALAKVSESDFDFILLDIEMPKMNGMEFYGYIKKLKPHLLKNIIFITGDTETDLTRNFINDSGCRFLDKPFMIRDLLMIMTEEAEEDL